MKTVEYEKTMAHFLQDKWSKRLAKWESFTVATMLVVFVINLVLALSQWGKL